MATASIALQAATPQDMETMTMAYLAQGFHVANRTSAQVTLIKKKELSVIWVVVLIFFFWTFIGLILLIIYLIMYASETDKMVTITVLNMPAQSYTGQLAPQAYPSGQLSAPGYPSGQLGAPGYSTGQIAPQGYAPQGYTPPASAPSGQFGPTAPSQWLSAPRSPDGYYWWDGTQWQPVPQGGQGQTPTGPMGY